MNKKRYAIVRVDKDYYLNSCPAGFENINNDFVCAYRKDKVLNQYVHNCKNCRYGDTKEQLIRKVAQVFFKRKLKAYKKLFDIVPNNADAKQVYKCCLEVAKEIVEFLGVEE